MSEHRIKAWKRLQILKRAYAHFHPKSPEGKEWHKAQGTEYRYSKIEDQIPREIHECREIISPTKITDKREKVANAIKANIQEALEYISMRNDLKITVGKFEPPDKRPKQYVKRSEIAITVGWMWNEKVWKPFYENKSLGKTHWFVLQAQEVKVNDPMVQLFRANVYDKSTDTMREAWIGKAKFGQREAVIRFTASAAALAVRELISHDLNTRIKGDDKK